MKHFTVNHTPKDDVKLFDFSLAKELDPDDEKDGGVYDLSGNTGSLRYIAPEVAEKEHYNLSDDVYSSTNFLWQICSLKTLFSNLNVKIHYELVIQNGVQPKINPN